MVDAYSKAILTVIAAALVAIVVQQAIPKADAFSGCGQTTARPCYIAIIGR